MVVSLAHYITPRLADHQRRDTATAAMILIIFILLTSRMASAAFTTTPSSWDEGDGTSWDEAFIETLYSDTLDEPGAVPELRLRSNFACRCVPISCCSRRGVTTSTPAQKTGAGSLEEQSSSGSSSAEGSGIGWCLRQTEVCCLRSDVRSIEDCEAIVDAAFGEQNQTVDSSGKSRCGTRDSVASHGSRVTAGQFPWFVTVWTQDGRSQLGAGVLIHPRLVATVTHIVEDDPATSLRVRLGGVGGAELAVAEAALHSDWGGKARYHDLALLLLQEPAPLSDAVRTACLGPATLDPGAFHNLTGCQTVQIVKGDQASSLRISNVQLLSRDECEDGLIQTGKLPNTFGLHYSFICAKTAADSESACRIESGAPVICDDPGRPDRTMLVGLLSWNAACRGRDAWPDVYTRMADIDNFCWLERAVAKLLGEKKVFFDEPLCAM